MESQWCAPSDIHINDAKLKNWLLSTGSLTERLQSHCRQFAVSVVGQGEAALSVDECQVLGSDNGNWIVREVILSGDGIPWVFARSVLPKAELENNLSMLSSLGNKPLGKVIFNDPQFERLPIQVTQLESTNPLLEKLSIISEMPLSARRSVFKYNDSRLLVAEVFLPRSPAYSQTMS
ncbi:chorismate lyase [Alteromonadaceae bacterium M269]|nr:chorismate lyase [Alteromonadaceae bacterium M269]